MNPKIAINDADIEYSDSDGEPMSDNTLQWDWMVMIVSELRVMFAGQEVFVAGDLLWYPVQGNPKTRLAPDGLIAFGRPPGYRGSYMQWAEGKIAPHVVFEVLSPKNTYDEMMAKKDFYERYGAEEFYIIDPYTSNAEGYTRHEDRLVPIPRIDGFVSPRLGIRFLSTNEGLILLTPDGREFQTREEHVAELYDEIQRAQAETASVRELIEAERQRTETERQRTEAERQRADFERQRADRERLAKEALMAKLREMGIDPETLDDPKSS